MRSWLWVFALVVFTVTLVRASDNGNAGGNTTGHTKPGQLRKKTGEYALKIGGDYSGTGTATIATKPVSISADIKYGKSTMTLSFSGMPLVNDRFQGKIMVNGMTFTISGRTDLPAATDADQTPTQANTGRITGTLVDTTGKGALLVAIQDEAARG